MGKSRKQTRKIRKVRKTRRKFRGGHVGGQRDVEVRFGVELEMCIKLDEACTGESVQFTPRALNSARGKGLGIQARYYSEVRVQWIDKFLKYAEHYIKPNPITPKIRDKYEYVYVKGWGKYSVDYIYDLTDFTLKPHRGNVDYTRPFFNEDGSILCGDRREFNAEKNPELVNTFNMEFITPILSSLDDLQDLLEFIGLTKKGCILTNKTAGYHVNLSLFDKTMGIPVSLDKPFFTNHFYPRFKAWEAEWYPRIRSEISMAAKPLSTIQNNSGAVYNTITKDKYYNVYIKNPELYEIRAFGATTDIPTLLDYTKQSIKLIEDSYQSYL